MLEEDGKHHQHNQLDWDDTPLTITVNPMQNWVDEDEEGLGRRGMSKLGGPTLHLSGAGHLVGGDGEEDEDDELDTSDSDEDEEEEEEGDSDQELDSEDDDSADSGSDEELDECIEGGRHHHHHSGLSTTSGVVGGSAKKGKRSSRASGHQLEWDSTI